MAVTFEIPYRILCKFIGFVMDLCSIFGLISFSSVPITNSAATSQHGAFIWLNLNNSVLFSTTTTTPHPTFS